MFPSFEILVETWKKRWKSLRDNFRIELKKVPVGRSGDPGLAVDQYLSKWPFFKIMFFLKDVMVWRKMSSKLLRPTDLQEAAKETCSPSPYTSSLPSDFQSQELNAGGKVMETESCPSFQVTSHEKINRKRKRNLEIDNDRLIEIEKEKLEVAEQKVQFLIEENNRREREDSNAHRHYLLSLLPLLAKVPKNKKLKLKNRIQYTFHEFIFEDGEERLEYRPTYEEMAPIFYRPW